MEACNVMKWTCIKFLFHPEDEMCNSGETWILAPPISEQNSLSYKWKFQRNTANFKMLFSEEVGEVDDDISVWLAP